MDKYIEFREGLTTNAARSNIIKLEDLPKNTDPFKDCYRSLFYSDESLLKHVADRGSVSGYRGKAGIDRIVWDFDHVDLNIARKDAASLVDRLITDYGLTEDEISIAFSGRKGFAVEICADGIEGIGGVIHENIPLIIKRFCTKLAGDLESFDRVIYNHNRLYRVAGTIHNKTSDVNGQEVYLFKTPLALEKLHDSVEDIKEHCMKLSDFPLLKPVKDTTKLSEVVTEINTSIDKATKELPSSLPTVEGLPDDNLAPKWEKTCLWRLAQGTVTDYRDGSLLRLAVNERSRGMPAEVITGFLRGVRDRMHASNPEKAALDPVTDEDIERIVNQSFNNDYDYGCNDPILDSVCSKKCKLAPKKFEDMGSSMVTFGEAYRKSRKFYKEYHKNIVPTGIKCIDENMPLFRGTLNLIVGKPGTGKTSLMLNILKNASDAGLPSMFFNMDMSEEMLIQRFAPILLRRSDGKPRFSGKEFMLAHTRGDTKLMEESDVAFEQLSQTIMVSSDPSRTVAEIKKEMEAHEQLWGKKIKLLIVDFVQLLRSDKEGWANHTFNAEELKNLAKQTNVCILGLSQPPRSGGKDEDLVAKGSGAWEENASTQLNCWRPFAKNEEYDWVMALKMAKNRMGPASRVDLYWSGMSGIIRDLDPGEEEMVEGIKVEFDSEE